MYSTGDAQSRWSDRKEAGTKGGTDAGMPDSGDDYSETFWLLQHCSLTSFLKGDDLIEKMTGKVQNKYELQNTMRS